MPVPRPKLFARLVGLFAVLLLGAAALVAPAAQAVAPNAPTGVSVLAENNGSLLVLWGPHPAEPDVTSFIVERSSNNGGFGQVGTASNFATSFLDYDYPLAGTVTYRIRSVNQYGEVSGPADSAPFTLPIPPFRVVPVSVTANVTTGAYPLTVDVTATTPAGSSARWTFGDANWVFGTSASHTFERPGVYTVTLRAERLAADGIAEIGYAQVLITVTEPPLAVAQNLRATSPRRGQVVLTWTNPRSSATGLQLNRVHTVGRRSVQVTWPLALTQSRFTDTTARSGTRYTYTLSATKDTATVFSNSVTISPR